MSEHFVNEIKKDSSIQKSLCDFHSGRAASGDKKKQLIKTSKSVRGDSGFADSYAEHRCFCDSKNVSYFDKSLNDRSNHNGPNSNLEIFKNEKDVVNEIKAFDNVLFHHERTISKEMVTIVVNQGAKLVLSSIGDKERAQRYIEYHIYLKKDAQCSFNVGFLDEADIECFLFLHLEEDGAKIEVKSFFALDLDQRCLLTIYQNHKAQRTHSNVVVKGMLKDESYALCKGLILLDENSQGSLASFENKNIVLSNKAKMVSIPSIEVLQPDVQCFHGSATGKFNKEHEWYLESKGFSLQHLQKLLIESFYLEIFDESQDKAKVVEDICTKMM